MKLTLEHTDFIFYTIKNGDKIFKHINPKKQCFIIQSKQETSSKNKFRYILVSQSGIDRNDNITFSSGETICFSNSDLQTETVSEYK